MNISDLITRRLAPFEPWTEGRTIPWDDAEFSARMMREHLSQAHDGASRRSGLIDRHVAFISAVALPLPPARVLDLGCGPGLYSLRLASQGHDCVGIDFAPASIAYAREQASQLLVRCRYELGDMREVEPGGAHDLVMLLYGELNLFPREEAVALLRRCANALAPGGRILLEVHAFEAVRARGEAGTAWSAHQSAVFSDRPHLRLDESFWLGEQALAGGRHWIIDAATAEARRYGWTMQAYSDEQYESLLSDAGLVLQERYGSLTGEEDGAGFPVIIAAPR